MIRLDTTTTKLQAVLAGAIATTQPQATVCYSDKTATAYTGGSKRTALNSTTDVDICSAPAAATVRDIDYISIFNSDTASVTVTVKYDISATDSTITTVTLATLETLQYVHGSGWITFAANGAIKTTAAATGILTAINGGTGFGSYAVGDILYADTTTTLARLADIATGNALITGGVGVAPSWGKISLTTHVSGTLPVANGGTGTTTSTGTGSTALSASPTFTGTVTAAAITGTGLLDLSAAGAGQIKFPATQNSSANANTLDDYEEGTWTPGISFGGGTTGITYSTQNGTYTKIGNSITIVCRIDLTSKGSSTGSSAITGLPFAAGATQSRATPPILITQAAVTVTGQVMAVIVEGTSQGLLQQLLTGTSTAITDAGFANNTIIFMVGPYLGST